VSFRNPLSGATMGPDRGPSGLVGVEAWEEPRTDREVVMEKEQTGPDLRTRDDVVDMVRGLRVGFERSL